MNTNKEYNAKSGESAKKGEPALRKISVENLIPSIESISRKITNLSGFVDFCMEDLYSVAFEKFAENAHIQAKKCMDFFMRHIV